MGLNLGWEKERLPIVTLVLVLAWNIFETDIMSILIIHAE